MIEIRSSSILLVLIHILHGTRAHCEVYTIGNVKVNNTIIQTIKSIGTNMCAEECLRTSSCKSFDYNKQHFECNLLDTLLTTEKSFENTSTTTEKSTVEYTWATADSNTTGYTSSLAGNPENNSNSIYEENMKKNLSARCNDTDPFPCGCDWGYKCVETFSSPTCVRIYCPKYHIDEEGTFVNITNASVGSNQTYWSSRDEEQRMSIVCQIDGTWSVAVKLRKPATCADIRKHQITRGEFWIYPNALHNIERVKVFCFGNEEYLTLNNSNWITQHDKTNLYHDPCSDLKEPLKTCYFKKIRFDPETLEVEGDNFRYTSGTCGTNAIVIGYGEGYDCSGGDPCTPHGSVNIDLTGTGMAVSTDTEWDQSGPGNPVKYFSMSSTREVVSFTCAGNCVRCRPDGVVSLSKSSENVPFESAAAVYCD